MEAEKDQFVAIAIPQQEPQQPALQQKINIFSKILQKSFGENKGNSNSSGNSSNNSEQKSAPSTPQPQKLFFRPGVIEEAEELEFFSRADSPLMFRTSQYIITPSLAVDLNRTSTCGSTLSHIGSRQDSRRARPGVAPRVKKRAILKNGDCNILQSRISKRRLRFLQDIFTTLVDTQWRWTLIVFALSFLLSWLGFAVIWWLIAFTHGDFEENHLPEYQEESKWIPCVSQLNSFTSCFLFSIETQHTIGYGSRATTEECPEAIFVMCLQSIAGVMIQAFMVGIVFAKMTRPKHRTQTLLFSKNAVICQRDGLLCLMFRVGDMRKSHIIGASIRAQLIRPKTTKEGEILNQYQTELSVSADGCDGDLFFIWPMTIVHKIEESSPLYKLSPSNFLNEQFEIVVILEGTIESTGQTTQARSSYIANEVLWGHRFEPVVSYSKDRRGYEVNYSKFDNVIQVDTPLCSGNELAAIQMNAMEMRSSFISNSPLPLGTKIIQVNSQEQLNDPLGEEYDSDRGSQRHFKSLLNQPPMSFSSKIAQAFPEEEQSDFQEDELDSDTGIVIHPHETSTSEDESDTEPSKKPNSAFETDV